MDITLLTIQWHRKLYEDNKDVDIDMYNARKDEAIKEYTRIESMSDESNKWDKRANTLEDDAKDCERYLSGRQLYEIDLKVKSRRDLARRYWAAAGGLEDFVTAKIIVDWYEDNSYNDIQAEKRGEEFKERQRRYREQQMCTPEEFFEREKKKFRQERKPATSIAEHLENAKAYCNRGYYDYAIEEYNEIIKLDPNNVDAYLGRGAVCSGYGDYYDQAIADLDYVIRSYPDNAMAYYYRAYAHSKKGANLKALADCNRAIQLEPNNADMYFSRSVVYLNIEKYDRAISDCDQAIRLDPHDVKLYIGRGAIYYDKKDDSKMAIKDFEAALRIDQNNALATQWLEKARRKK